MKFTLLMKVLAYRFSLAIGITSTALLALRLAVKL